MHNLRFPVVIVLLLLSVSALGAVPGFHGLGFLPDAPGGTGARSEAYGISADGSTVVGFGSSGSTFQAFRWTAAGGMQGLGTLASDNPYSDAVAISADGKVVVGESRLGANMVAFQWTAGGGPQPVGFPLGGTSSDALAVSADGSYIAGYYDGPVGRVGFRWSAANGRQDLPLINGVGRQPNGISADGSVVVGGGPAFLWDTTHGYRFLNDLTPGPIVATTALALSPDAKWVVGSVPAFRWSADTGIQSLGELADGTVMDRAMAVSADGNTIVGDGLTKTHGEAFIWDSTTGLHELLPYLTDDLGLDLTGWSLDFASGISADGMTLIGKGVNPSGQTEAWIVTLPEPAAAAWVPIVILLGLPRKQRKLRTRARIEKGDVALAACAMATKRRF